MSLFIACIIHLYDIVYFTERVLTMCELDWLGIMEQENFLVIWIWTS
jgi:hypothetical protein